MKRMSLILAVFGLLFCVSARAADTLSAPVKSVYDHYLRIQVALAKDSIKGVDAEAAAVAAAIRGDAAKALSTDVATQADTLAKAKDLTAARDAFQKLSQSLVQDLADHKVQSGLYNEVFCPMVNANWLQSGKTVSNPYLVWPCPPAAS